MITFLISLCVIVFMACMVLGGWLLLVLIGVAAIIAVIVGQRYSRCCGQIIKGYLYEIYYRDSKSRIQKRNNNHL